MSRAVTRKTHSPAAIARLRVIKSRAGEGLELEEALARVRRGERVVLRRVGKAVAVVMSVADLKLFEKLEDRMDIQLAEEGFAEPGEPVEYRGFFKKLRLKDTTSSQPR